MTSKATPIDHLPNPSIQGNVQMQMTPEQTTGINMPPQPQHHNPQMPDGHQMYQQMNMDQEGERENVQNNYVNRQFVQPPINTYRPPDSDIYGHPEQYPEQMPTSSRHEPPQKYVEDNIVPSDVGILQLLMIQNKTLAIVFALLVAVQLETSQSLFRKLARLMKVPDTMIFNVSKVFLSLVGVIIFFFVCRNL